MHGAEGTLAWPGLDWAGGCDIASVGDIFMCVYVGGEGGATMCVYPAVGDKRYKG